MSDWLQFLIQFGGVGAVVVVAVTLMGRWLWGKINKALDSYVSAYTQQSASIDARIANLEKLAEEQARLTRIVEGIKDEIAAQAKIRDNRWEFRKDVYVNLINRSTDLITALSRLQVLAEQDSGDGERLGDCYKGVMSSVAEFVRHANLAPLATADSILQLVSPAAIEMMILHDNTPDELERIGTLIERMYSLRSSLQENGRKDLWGTPEYEAKAEAVKSV